MGKINTFWQQIRRSPYQTLAAVMIMFFTFLAISCFLLISLGSLRILQHFEKAPQVIAFFEPGKDLSDERIAQIRQHLEATGKLEDFRYVSTHEAEKIYKDKVKDDPLLLELVDYKILPASIEISAHRAADLLVLKTVLEEVEEVKDIDFFEDVVRSLASWVRNVRLIGLILVAYLLLQSVLVIVVVIGMKILARREEIGIMSLIGASRWFIRWPFIFEGAFYGLIGAFFGWLFSYIILLYSTPLLLNWFSDVKLLPVPPLLMFELLLAQVLMGVLVGAFASFLAVWRFLRD